MDIYPGFPISILTQSYPGVFDACADYGSLELGCQASLGCIMNCVEFDKEPIAGARWLLTLDKVVGEW